MKKEDKDFELISSGFDLFYDISENLVSTGSEFNGLDNSMIYFITY